MPFDATPDSKLVNRLRLIEALRSDNPGFRWNFTKVYDRNRCGTVGCAIGLAKHIGIIPEFASFGAVADAIGISRHQARQLFMPLFRCKSRYGVSIGNVTPAMVADKLEALSL